MLVAGNWKMNTGLDDAVRLAAEVVHATEGATAYVAVCPPAVWLEAVAERVGESAVALGAQNVHPENEGAFTGEVSPPMLSDLDVRYVIVGHSERREGCGESDAIVRAKAERALADGLDVILCVGESKAVRDAGHAERHVPAQLAASLPGYFDPTRLAIAYEPIWAIGTGDVATVADVVAMHAALRATLASRIGDDAAKVRLLYGGSVNGDNAAELLAAANVDGALVGGASLTAAKFVPIIAAAAAI